MVSIEWTKDAEFDFDQILSYFSNTSSQYALNFYEKVGQTRLEELERFFKALHPRSLSYSSAVYASKLYGTILKGNAIGWRDTVIASIVKENGNEIITSNALHFSRVPNLKVVEY
ncbi:MAG: hypothetical protein EU530_08100 [Promethearchaeota archaeon]|nr:MAG: hypothetical protein EU530_08100 [Candidatus Lokiarchaeota archaeon]